MGLLFLASPVTNQNKHTKRNTIEERKMSNSTNEVELEQCDTTSIDPTSSIADRLPELSNEAIQDAMTDDSVEWAQGMLEHYEPGAIHDMPDYGITLQIVSSDTARCIGVFDHGYCMLMLQMVITTFENAGLTLEIDPWAVLRPYEAPEEAAESSVEAPQNSTGQGFAMEIV